MNMDGELTAGKGRPEKIIRDLILIEITSMNGYRSLININNKYRTNSTPALGNSER